MQSVPILVHLCVCERNYDWILIWVVCNDLLKVLIVSIENEFSFIRWNLNFFDLLFFKVIIINIVWGSRSNEWLRIKSIHHLIPLLIVLCPKKLLFILAPIICRSHYLRDLTLTTYRETNIVWHVLESLDYIELAISTNKLISEVCWKASSKVGSSLLAHPWSKGVDWVAFTSYFFCRCGWYLWFV